MTIVRSREDVTRLVIEMSQWGNDPDFGRIADAIPLEVLELAYLKKLAALARPELPAVASTVAEKISVLRRILVAWCRTEDTTLAQLISNACCNSADDEIFFCSDSQLVASIELSCPPSP